MQEDAMNSEGSLQRMRSLLKNLFCCLFCIFLMIEEFSCGVTSSSVCVSTLVQGAAQDAPSVQNETRLTLITEVDIRAESGC